ncbi:hypothetical protein [Ruegeria arenilitoris]|uniref:hypothetical protein n=1 Tax=Ruegeria arenilitoris TaxID=1173585 RepID=UPI0014810664|nr:hypothetical protein [Ruegeria arenilitoris]
MYESAAQQLLPIEAAILEALNLVPSASTALDELIEILEPTGARIAYRFGSRLRAGEVFTDRDLEDLETLIKPVLAKIEQGWVSEVIPDEHCPKGAWINRRLTNEAAALERATAPLVTLAGLLQTIKDLKCADRITRRFLAEANV